MNENEEWRRMNIKWMVKGWGWRRMKEDENGKLNKKEWRNEDEGVKDEDGELNKEQDISPAAV